MVRPGSALLPEEKFLQNPQLALPVLGMMNPVPVAATTVAIAAERFAPAPMRVARLVGGALLVTGVVAMARG